MNNFTTVHPQNITLTPEIAQEHGISTCNRLSGCFRSNTVAPAVAFATPLNVMPITISQPIGVQEDLPSLESENIPSIYLTPLQKLEIMVANNKEIDKLTKERNRFENFITYAKSSNWSKIKELTGLNALNDNDYKEIIRLRTEVYPNKVDKLNSKIIKYENQNFRLRRLP